MTFHHGTITTGLIEMADSALCSTQSNYVDSACRLFNNVTKNTPEAALHKMYTLTLISRLEMWKKYIFARYLSTQWLEMAESAITNQLFEFGVPTTE